MAFATAADMLVRYDARTLADLAGDTGEPVADLSAAPRLLAALEDAAGQILAAALVGRMYSAADLAALTGPGLGLLQRLNCELAMGYMLAARPERYGSEAIAAARKEAEEYLSLLRKGDRIFPMEEVQDAGLPTIDGPTALEHERMNLITARSPGYYPATAGRFPRGQQ